MPGGKIRQVYPWQETVTSDRYEGKIFFTELEHTVQMILERSDKRGGGQVVSGRDRQSKTV